MYYTNEYTVLTSNNGGEDKILKPNIPFQAFEGDYTVTAFARVKNSITNETIGELQAGQKTTGVGVVPKKTIKTIVKELIDEPSEEK